MDLTGTAAQRDVERRRANSWPPAEPGAHDVHAADLRMTRASTTAPGDEEAQRPRPPPRPEMATPRPLQEAARRPRSSPVVSLLVWWLACLACY